MADLTSNLQSRVAKFGTSIDIEIGARQQLFDSISMPFTTRPMQCILQASRSYHVIVRCGIDVNCGLCQEQPDYVLGSSTDRTG
eukprot:1592949-Amphidinium_carterae.1